MRRRNGKEAARELITLAPEHKRRLGRPGKRHRLGLVLVCVFMLSCSIFRPTPPPAAEKPVTLAVLNFTNRNPGDGWDWLEKGLADLLITDLSKSGSIIVVERERMASMLRELELAERGVVDASTAGRIGRICKVDWVLFGSFIKQGDQIKIEAHIVEVETGRLLRVEWVEGEASTLFALEKELAYRILTRLDVPLSEDERRIIDEFPTDSIPAFEHYSRSLDYLDRGEPFDALLECRLAVKDDPAFLKVAARMAELYYQLGEHKHAMVEYQAVYQQILARYPEYERLYEAPGELPQPNDLTQEKFNFEKVKTTGAAHDISLRTLERLALFHENAGQDFEAARRYSQIVSFMFINHMARPVGIPWGALRDRVWEKYAPLYWRFVRENRDTLLYPPMPVYRIPVDGGSFGEEVPFYPYRSVGHGYLGGRVFIAPPGKEIAELTVSADCSAIEHPGEATHVSLGWYEPGTGSPRLHWMKGAQKHFEIGSGWQTAHFELERGVRAVKLDVPKTPGWKATFTLRPWSPAATVSKFGAFGVNFVPEWAHIYLDGKRRSHTLYRGSFVFTRVRAGEHMVEVRWPDGRRASKRFYLEPGANINIFLSPYILSHQRLPTWGSHTYLFADQEGRLWLLWDQALKDYRSMHRSQESDLFYATSTDGVKWSAPRRLPVSSWTLDMKPVLQQDRSGVYWLVWSSSRDPEDPKWLWIASSEDGLKWSFPRKIVLPMAEKRGLSFAFTIDKRDTFWLIWRGRLFRSEDAEKWTEVEVLNIPSGQNYFLAHDQANRLLLLTKAGGLKIALWRRWEGGRWENIGLLAEDQAYFGALSLEKQGRVAAVFARNTGIFLRTYEDGVGWSKKVVVESYFTDPEYPSIAVLPNGRYVVAYCNQDGIVAVVFKPTSAFSFEPGREK